MTETPSIYKPHKPTRKIGDPFFCGKKIVSGDDIVHYPLNVVNKAVVVLKDYRTDAEVTMNYYFANRVSPDWEKELPDRITRDFVPLGYEIVEIKYFAEVTVDVNTKSLFEAVPEEDRVVYKDELATE